MEYINAIELKKKIDLGESVTVIDIRESYELDICKVDSFKHIPMSEVVERTAEFSNDNSVVICCRSGKRAVALANLLIEDQNLRNISVLEGGILAWIEKVDNQLEVY